MYALKVSGSTADIVSLIIDFGTVGVNSKLQVPAALRRGRNPPLSVEYYAGRISELVWTL